MISLFTGFHSPGIKLAATLGMAFVAAGAIAAGPFQIGDIVYTDSFGAVFKINPATGERAIVARDDKLVQPFGIALEANGDVLVTDTGALAIVRIDSQTGSQSVVATGGLLGIPYGIAVDRKGDILIANLQAIVRVNPLTGEQAIVSAGGHFGVGYPLGVAVAENGDLIVANVGFPSEIIRVNPRTGQQTLLAKDGYLRFPQSIAVDGNDIYLTVMATADQNFGIGRVIHVDMHSGRQTEVSTGCNLVKPVGIAVDGNGQLVVGDPYSINLDSVERYDGAIIRVDPLGGGQTLIARGQDNYVNPLGIAIVRAVQPKVR